MIPFNNNKIMNLKWYNSFTNNVNFKNMSILRILLY